MKTIKLLSIIAVVAVIFNSCTKDGATGPAGANGTNGNANVSVATYTIAPSSWGSDGNGGWYAALIPSIDPTQGAVSIFYSPDDISWTGLPFVGYTVGAPDVNFAFSSTVIDIYYDAQTGVSSIAQPSNTVYIKVTLIPPAIMIKHPETNWNNTIEVAQLPEVQAALHK
jgi:hypothetical protein